MDYTIVVPTIREDLVGFKEAIADIESSFTLPTDFRVLHGEGGKVPTLNRAFDDILKTTDAPIYVTLDDDCVPSPGWQDAVKEMFALRPDVGIVCPWLGETPEMRAYVGPKSVRPWREKAGLRYRLLAPWRHIPGCLLAFRRETALAIGKTPESTRIYDIYEDCWRGRMAYKLGWRSAYVDAGAIRFVTYVDTDEYINIKADDIDEARPQTQKILAQYGIADPLSWRMRQLLARMLGRAKPAVNIYREQVEKK